MNDPISTRISMPNPFEQTAQKLKALRDKLNINTYTAVFGHTIEQRQQATTEATRLANEIEGVMEGAWYDATKIVASAGSTSPHQGGVLAALDRFLQAVEEPLVTKMQAGSQASPCSAAASLVRPAV